MIDLESFGINGCGQGCGAITPIVHARYGHYQDSRFRKHEDKVKLFLKGPQSLKCQTGVCVQSKGVKLPFRIRPLKELKKLDEVQTDTGGPVSPRSATGKRYVQLFLERMTRYKWVYFLSARSQFAQALKEFYYES